jgi:1-aminocyclopropane-1-carboxylate deaminase
MRPMQSAAPIVCARGLRGVHVVQDYERCIAPGVCGNKARKLMSLADLPAHGLVSHGGGQSNAMLALALLAKHRSSFLTYHTRPLPNWLRDAPSGNLGKALTAGMKLVEHGSDIEYRNAVRAAKEMRKPGFVPQGAAWPAAESGVAELANEIYSWTLRDGMAAPEAPLAVVVPAGTGTTALFLARHLRQLAVPSGAAVNVYAVPCVGTADYLEEQMFDLDRASGSVGMLPTVISPPPELRTPFGKPALPLLDVWRTAAKRHGVLLDLVYGAVAWGTLASLDFAPAGRRPAGTTLYVNAGGHEGLGSSLRRYARAGLLREGETAQRALKTALETSGVLLRDDPFA